MQKRARDVEAGVAGRPGRVAPSKVGQRGRGGRGSRACYGIRLNTSRASLCPPRRIIDGRRIDMTREKKPAKLISHDMQLRSERADNNGDDAGEPVGCCRRRRRSIVAAAELFVI